MVSTRDKFKGCMVGLALGDALGMPCESYSFSAIVHNFGRITNFLDPDKENHPNYRLKAGMYTDDTEQAIVLAESLIENSGLDVNHFANKLLGEYGKNIIENPELDRWIGSTFKKAVKNYISGKPPTKCGVKAKSCGSAMRVAPMGLVYWDHLINVAKNAARSSRVTHIGAETTAAAEAVALYVALAARETHSPEEMSEVVTQMVGRESKIIAKRIKKSYELKDKKPEKVLDILGDSQLARETLSSAIYSFNRSPYNFKEAVLTSVNLGGDTDSRAAITGAISGSFNGLYRIPYRWVERLENKERLIQLGKELDIASGKQLKMRLQGSK